MASKPLPDYVKKPPAPDIEDYAASRKVPVIPVSRWELTQSLGRDAAKPKPMGDAVIVVSFAEQAPAVGVCAEAFRYLKPLFLAKDQKVNGFILKNGIHVLFLVGSDVQSWRGLNMAVLYVCG